MTVEGTPVAVLRDPIPGDVWEGLLGLLPDLFEGGALGTGVVALGAAVMDVEEVACRAPLAMSREHAGLTVAGGSERGQR